MRWAEAKRIEDKKRALREALAEHTSEEAAEILGISPRHVYRLKRLLLEETPVTVVTGLTPETGVTSLTPVTVVTGRQDVSGEERTEGLTATHSVSLPYGGHERTFPRMGSVANMVTEELEDTKVQLPKDVKQYLQVRAIRETERGHPSMSRVLVDLVRREMARERAEGTDE